MSLDRSPYVYRDSKCKTVYDARQNKFDVEVYPPINFGIPNIASQFSSIFKLLMNSSTRFIVRQGYLLIYSRHRLWTYRYMEYDPLHEWINCKPTLTQRHPIIDKYRDTFNSGLWKFTMGKYHPCVIQGDRILSYADPTYCDLTMTIYAQFPPGYTIRTAYPSEHIMYMIVCDEATGDLYYCMVDDSEEGMVATSMYICPPGEYTIDNQPFKLISIGHRRHEVNIGESKAIYVLVELNDSTDYDSDEIVPYSYDDYEIDVDSD